MKITVLSGDSTSVSHRRSELVGDATTHHLDVAADGFDAVWRAVTTTPLFGGSPVLLLENFDAVTAAEAQQLAGVGGDRQAVARANRQLTPKVRKALGPDATFEHLAEVRKPTDVQARVRNLAREQGVRLDRDSLTALAERCADDPERARSALWQLHVVGATSPTAVQVAAVAAGPGRHAPWVVIDHLLAGNLAAALTETALCPPPAVVAALGSELSDAGQALEAGAATADAAAAVLGKPAWLCRRTATVAARLQPATVASSWQVVRDAHLGIRSTDPERNLAVAVAKLAPWWGPGATRPR